MARRRPKESIGVSFFSFLDIMTATMGTLILILICTTIIAMKMEKKNIYIKLKADKTMSRVKRPVFIECVQDKLIIYPQLFETTLAEIQDRESYFMRLLYDLDRNQSYVIFAIRPNGYDIFKKARGIAEGLDVDIGFEPLDKYWQLKLDRDDLPLPVPEYMKGSLKNVEG